MQQKCWQPEEILENKYKIKRVLGQGMMGISYEVEHFDWDIPLRLKCFHQEYWQEHFHQIKHTLDHWISLEGHPHLVHAFYWDHIVGDQPILCTEYIPGVPLSQAVKDFKDLHQSLDVAIQIGYALQECHQNRLVHGNLHPYNILFYNQMALLEDFVGLPNNIPHVELVKYELLGYARLIFFLCCSTDWPTNHQLAITPGVQPRGWSISTELADFIQKLLHSEITNLDDTIEVLKTEYEKVSEGAYKRATIVPTRIQVEKFHKQAMAYYEIKEINQAQNLWTLAGENSPASMNALWNSYLANLRLGLVSLDMFMKTMEELAAFEHTQILYAQSELSLEVGCHIQDILERLEEIPDLPAFLLRIKGEILYRIRQYPEAIECFQKLIESPQHEADDWYRLAVTYFSIKNWEQTLAICKQWQQETPHHTFLQLIIAATHYCQEQIEIASQEFTELEDKFPTNLWILVHLADFYAGKGLYQREVSPESKTKAKQLYSQVLQINPQMTRALRGSKVCGGEPIVKAGNNSTVNFIEWSQIRCLNGHENIVTALAITPDSHWLASGDSDGNLYLWDTTTGILQTGLIGHSKHISSLAITQDGTRVASASWDYTIRIWEAPAGSCLWEIQGHHDNITKVRFTSDGRFLISGSWDGTAQIWDVISHEHIATLPHTGAWVQDVAIFPDGKLALTCTDQEDVFLWDVAKAEIIQQIRGLSIFLSQDSKIVITSYYNTIEIWEMPSFKQLDCINTTHKELCLGLTEDKALLLTKNEDDMLSFWDLLSKRKLSIFHSEEANCAVVNCDGNSLATSMNTTIYLWENMVDRPFPLFRHAHFLAPQIHDYLKTPEIVGQTYRNAEKAFQRNQYDEAFRMYQTLLKIPGYETSDLLYSLLNQAAFRHPILRKGVSNILLRGQSPMIGYATACCLAADGRIVLVANDDDPIRQWNLRSGYISHRWEGHCRCVCSLAIDHNGSHALSGSWDGSVIFWHLDYPQHSQLAEISKNWVTSVAMNAEATRGLAGTRDGKIILINLATMECNNLNINPSNQTIVFTLIKNDIGIISLYDGTVVIWDLLQNQLIAQHRPHGRQITAMDATYEGRLIISSSRNGSILLWEIHSGKVIKEFRHTGEVIKHIRLINDRMFITLSKDGGLRIWCLDNQESLNYFYAHDNPITTADISEDGRFMVSADENKIIKLWELEWEWRWELPKSTPTSM